MERTIVAFSIMLTGLLLLLPPDFSSAQPAAVCISQFALANQACAVLPSEQALAGRNRTRSQDDDDSDSVSPDDDDDDEDDNEDDNDDDESSDDGDDGGDDNDDDDDENESRHKRGKKHSGGNKKGVKKGKKGGKKTKKGKKGKKGKKHGGGGHGHKDDEPRANKDCCRWLQELDETCVCDALLRLPAFLVKPTHKYSIKVGKSCKFTYKCYGI